MKPPPTSLPQIPWWAYLNQQGGSTQTNARLASEDSAGCTFPRLPPLPLFRSPLLLPLSPAPPLALSFHSPLFPLRSPLSPSTLHSLIPLAISLSTLPSLLLPLSLSLFPSLLSFHFSSLYPSTLPTLLPTLSLLLPLCLSPFTLSLFPSSPLSFHFSLSLSALLDFLLLPLPLSLFPSLSPLPFHLLIPLFPSTSRSPPLLAASRLTVLSPLPLL